jgi:hypothetical protein
LIKKFFHALYLATKPQIFYEEQKLLSAKLLVENVKSKDNIASIQEVEFKVFSQWGDDGIIQWLIHHIDIPHRIFIEFGVQDYRESNTRFLLMNDNWSGLVIDGSDKNIRKIIESEYYWKYDLTAKTAFVDCDNINNLLLEAGFPVEIGLVHIDIDGNDYWVWEKITCINPIIAIIEYNSIFGIDRAITIPYDKNFDRAKAHYSYLYFGASLKALHHLANRKGYGFIGCNSAGNNAFFVRKDKLNDMVKEVSLEEGYVLSKFRESRDVNGELNYLYGEDRLKVLKGLLVINIITNQIETL